MLVLTDNDFVEGLLGVLSLLISVLILQNTLYTNNLLVVSILFWLMLWLFRKIGMNIYQQYKEKYNIDEKVYNIEKVSITKKNIFIICSVILFGFAIIITTDFNLSEIENLFTKHFYKILLLSIIIIIGSKIFSEIKVSKTYKPNKDNIEANNMNKLFV